MGVGTYELAHTVLVHPLVVLSKKMNSERGGTATDRKCAYVKLLEYIRKPKEPLTPSSRKSKYSL